MCVCECGVSVCVCVCVSVSVYLCVLARGEEREDIARQTTITECQTDLWISCIGWLGGGAGVMDTPAW